MIQPVLLSIQVGLPRQTGREGSTDPMDRLWTTAFFKEPVDGPVWLRSTNLDGDRQADLKRHGGPEKAVLSYSAEHYPVWQTELGRPEVPFGSFGENFTIAQLSESTVCIGDIFQIGDAILQVSEPRLPCWKIARRFGIRDMAVKVQAANRAGWYLRVLREGRVHAGLPVLLLERTYPRWTVSECITRLGEGPDHARLRAEFAECPVLGTEWRDRLSGRAEVDDERRFWGPKPSVSE